MSLPIGIMLSIGAQGGGGPAPFPVSMFSGGKAGAFYDTSNLGSLFQEISSPTTPAVVDGRVGTRRDLSGNGNHQAALSDAGRPTLRSDGTRYWLEYPSSGTFALVGGSVTGVGNNGAVFFGLGHEDNSGIIALYIANASVFLGATTSGSGLSAHTATATVTQYNVDGVPVTGTRGALFTALANSGGSTPHLFEARGADLSGLTTTRVGAPSGSFLGLRRDYGLLVISETDLADNEDAVRDWFNAKMGL